MREHPTRTADETDSADLPDLLVVDAANVVGSRPDGWWHDRAGAARRLVDAVSAAGRLADRSVVVLEGAARAGVPATGEGPVEIVHAAGSGDDAITEVVAAAGAAAKAAPAGAMPVIVVVTSDRGLRERVERHGARTRGPRWLWSRIDPSR